MSHTLTIQKIAAALIGVAMITGAVFAFAAQRAHAVTLSELVELFIALDIIPEDKADEARAALKDADSTGGSTGGSGSCAATFSRDLKVGSQGQDVMDLQKTLNMWSDTTVALSGAGSKGMETMYYGPATAAAVSKFQVKYAADILTPLGLTKGTGFFGASTRAKLNAVCKGGLPGTPGTPGDDDDDDDNEMSDEEASLEDFEALNSPSNEDVQPGDEEVQVYGFTFDVEDGDVEVNRIDVNFQSDDTVTTKSEDPWDYFESVQIVNEDGDVLAEMDADEDNWEDDQDESVTSSANETYRLRFTSIDDAMFNAGDAAELFVAVTVQDNIDSDDEDQDWNVWIPEDGIRAVDGAGLDQYAPDSDISDTESQSFTVEAEGAGEALNVSLASSNPDASTIKVDEDDETDDVTVLVFELEAEDNDIEINSLPVRWTTSGPEFNDIVSDVVLEVDGEEYDDYGTLASSSAASGFRYATTTFDIDGDLVIEADETVEVKVIVTFNSTEEGANYANGTTLLAEVTGPGVDLIDAEGADELAAADLSGSAVGDTHTLVAEGITAEIVSTDASLINEDTAAADKADFQIKFDVTAFEEDFYIGKAATSSGVTTNGVGFNLEFSDDTLAATNTGQTLVGSLGNTSGADSDGNFWIVREGETETFTLDVTYGPSANGAYRLELTEINYNTTAASGNTVYTPSPEEDFETDTVTVSDNS